MIVIERDVLPGDLKPKDIFLVGSEGPFMILAWSDFRGRHVAADLVNGTAIFLTALGLYLPNRTVTRIRLTGDKENGRTEGAGSTGHQGV